jgi:hypothetical protein
MGAVCFFKRIGRELRFEIDRLLQRSRSQWQLLASLFSDDVFGPPF